MKKGKVFVTGATGFLGINLVQELIRQNYEVKGLDRNSIKFPVTDDDNLQLIEGNALDFEYSLLSDCDAVIHLIGETTPNLPYEAYRPINVEAALNVLHAAIQNKIKRFVFVSTANTIGYADDYGLGSEEKPIRQPYDECQYAMSKLEAEERLLQYSHQIDIIIANPTFMIGANDFKPTSGRVILNGLQKKVIFHPPGGKNFVHVHDVAFGLIKCLELGKNGNKYLLAGENLSFRNFYLKLNAQLDQKAILIKIPKWAMGILGWFGDHFLKKHFQTGLSCVDMKILCLDNYYSNQKSVRELKLKYHPIDMAIAEAVTFFQSDNFVLSKKHK